MKGQLQLEKPHIQKWYVLLRSHIGWRGERSIPYKSVETSPYREADGDT